MNVLDTLIAFRPTDEDLESAWPTEDRPALRARVIASSLEPHDARAPWARRHRRVVAVVAVAATIAAAGVVVTATLPSGAPGAPDAAAAASIERLAVVAGEQGGTVRPDQLAYTWIVYKAPYQDDDYPREVGWVRVGDEFQQSVKQWTAPSGDLWLYRSCLREHPADYREPLSNNPNPVAPAYGNYANASAAELAAMPTDTSELAAFLDAHPTGDNHGATGRFMAISDLLRSGLAGPDLRAAALRVLAQTDGIEVSTGVRDSLGRAAIRVDHTTRERVKSRFFHRYGNVTESLLFDPRTSRVLEEQGGLNGKVGSRTVVNESSIVNAIPKGLNVCPEPTVQPG